MGSAIAWRPRQDAPSSSRAATRAASDSRPDPTAPGRSATVWRLSDPAAFSALRASRHRVRRGPLSVAWVASPVDEPPRVAYAIGKRVGGAVERNRIRRRLRTVMADLDPAPGRYLVSVAPAGSELPFLDLKALVSNALLALPTPENTPLESSGR